MKQVQEELERERKEKEAAQAEVLLLKTKISELGYLHALFFHKRIVSLTHSLTHSTPTM